MNIIILKGSNIINSYLCAAWFAIRKARRHLQEYKYILNSYVVFGQLPRMIAASTLISNYVISNVVAEFHFNSIHYHMSRFFDSFK